MGGYKFDQAKMARLDDPGRLEDLRPDVMWEALGAPESVGTIVDVGAGTGVFAEQFALLAPGAVVYAADTSQGMLDWIADKRASLVESGRIVPVLSDETTLPLPDASADLAIMVNMHHELDDPVALYEDIRRILRPGGRMLVVDWTDRDTPHGPPLAIRASEEQIVEALRSAGFEDIEPHCGLRYHSLLTSTKPA